MFDNLLCNDSTMASTDAKAISRKRLVPLLEARLNDQTIPHLSWIDKENKIFRIPWRHHKTARWGDPDAFMLRELATVMYNYNGPEVPTKKDLSYWKELLRNNLKTLRDFEELTHMHVLESDNPFRVYRFTSNGTKQGNKYKDKTAAECQGRGSHSRRNTVGIATESSSETMIDLNNCLDFLDDSVNGGCSLMSHAGVCPCGGAACDNMIMSSSQESAYLDDSPRMSGSYTDDITSTSSHQVDKHNIFEELFQNNDPQALDNTGQFDLDTLNDAFGIGFNESSAQGNSFLENMPYGDDYLNFLGDTPSHAPPLMPRSGAEPRDIASDENVNFFNIQGSAFQNGSPYRASACSDSLGDLMNCLVQPVDQNDVPEERFMNSNHITYQTTGELNASALKKDGFDFNSIEPTVHSNNCRSRSPLTAGIIPHHTTFSSYASSSCNAVLGNSTQHVSSSRLGQRHTLTNCGLVNKNSPQEVASVFRQTNYASPAGNTASSLATCLVPNLAQTLGHRDLVTAEGTPAGINNIDMPGFGRRTFQSLTRMLTVMGQMPLGVETSYYNSPSIEPQLMPGQFRICFVGDSDEREGIKSCLNEELIGPRHAQLLELPPAQNCPRLSAAQINNTNKVLSNIKAGIIVSIKDGDIYATRYCKAGSSFSIHGISEWQKLPRLTEMKIFDYDNYKLSYSFPNQVPNSQPFVRLSFAARDPSKTISVVTADIWHMEALLLTRQAEENSASLEPDMSLSNDFDKILSIGNMLKASRPSPE